MPTYMIDEFISTFRSQKALAEKAIVQLADEQFHTALNADTNSIAVIMKHMAGNMLSRWTDFLTSDGEKPQRDRDNEFVDTFTSRAQIMAFWDTGWTCLFSALASLSDDDLAKTVTTRGQPSTVTSAILRQISHYGYHIGQIVQIARILVGDRWQIITIPKGGSKEFNERSGVIFPTRNSTAG
jgi:Protein of unknown function (DUF1572)